jgi:hypothetical protein
MYLLYPETTGLSMEELDQIFISASGPLDVVARAKKAPRRSVDAVATLEDIDNEKSEEKKVEHI